jgi:probable phosphoglycerate mutase
MDNKKIFLIRHGETQFNKLGIVQGSGVDTDLNSDGILQAEAFFEAYQHIQFDKVYTSKLKRTYQTINKFVEVRGVPHQSLWGLNEISWGSKEGRRTTHSEDKSYYEMLRQWKNGNIHAKSNGGESPWEVCQRQRLAWQYIMSNWHEKNILVCMHGRAIRILLCELMGLPIWEMDSFAHSNTCLYLLEFEKGSYRIELANDTSHLKVMETKEL